MKKLMYFVGMFLALGFCAKADLFVGDVIGVDFGSTATAEANWNTGVTNTTTDLLRLSDGANTDVDLTITSAGGTPVNNSAVWVDGSGQGGSSVSTIYNDGIILAGRGDDTITLTFTGLDDTLRYTLFAGGLTAATSFGADWDVSTSAAGGINQETNFQDTEGYVTFSQITSVGGTFSLSMNDISDAGPDASGRNIGLSELRLTATNVVPEPSSLALLGLGAMFLFSFRRQRQG